MPKLSPRVVKKLATKMAITNTIKMPKNILYSRAFGNIIFTFFNFSLAKWFNTFAKLMEAIPTPVNLAKLILDERNLVDKYNEELVKINKLGTGRIMTMAFQKLLNMVEDPKTEDHHKTYNYKHIFAKTVSTHTLGRFYYWDSSFVEFLGSVLQSFDLKMDIKDVLVLPIQHYLDCIKVAGVDYLLYINGKCECFNYAVRAL